MTPRSADSTPTAEDWSLPDRLGPDRGRPRGPRRSWTPRSSRSSGTRPRRGVRARQPRGSQGPGDVYLEPLEPPRRLDDLTTLPTRGARRPRPRRRRTTSSTCGGARRSRRSSTPRYPSNAGRRGGGDLQGQGADPGRLEHRRVPRGDAFDRRVAPAVPPRDLAAGARHKMPVVPIAIVGAYAAMPKGAVAPQGAHRSRSVRAADRPARGRDAPAALAADAAGCGRAVRRGPRMRGGRRRGGRRRTRRRASPVPSAPGGSGRGRGSRPIRRAAAPTWK